MPELDPTASAVGVAADTRSALISTASALPARRMYAAAFALFLFSWTAVTLEWWVEIEPWVAQWTNCLFLLLAAGLSLITLARRLPVQNVLMVAVLVAITGGGLDWLATALGFSFGTFAWTDRMRTKLFGPHLWTIPFIWLVIVLTARGAAEWVLRPWRWNSHFGYWVLSLACALAALALFSLNAVAVSSVDPLISVQTSAGSAKTAPGMNWLGWMMISFLVQLISLPWLINKRPGKERVDFHSLLLWSMLTVWLALGQAAHQLWGPLSATFGSGGLLALLAALGTRSGPGLKSASHPHQ